MKDPGFGTLKSDISVYRWELSLSNVDKIIPKYKKGDEKLGLHLKKGGVFFSGFSLGFLLLENPWNFWRCHCRGKSGAGCYSDETDFPFLVLYFMSQP